ncbi:hypothetical protein PR048_031367 [Dryococelus australis]|uniref:Uncharacterized protein n=1 Tax=Dryococelus australis TaxID=614101 RepID=A0ABQ9G517_9NEOP|nr:hypothetical protein PR048_031367 [Dryococelus australis]
MKKWFEEVREAGRPCLKHTGERMNRVCAASRQAIEGDPQADCLKRGRGSAGNGLEMRPTYPPFFVFLSLSLSPLPHPSGGKRESRPRITDPSTFHLSRTAAAPTATSLSQILFFLARDAAIPSDRPPLPHTPPPKGFITACRKRMWRGAQLAAVPAARGRVKNGISPRKPADQRHHPVRFPHAKFRERSRWESDSVRLTTVRVDFSSSYNSLGATMTERLACSSPTKAIRVQSPYWITPDFRMWESSRTIPLVGGISRGSPVSPALSFRRCSNSPHHAHRLSKPRCLRWKAYMIMPSNIEPRHERDCSYHLATAVGETPSASHVRGIRVAVATDRPLPRPAGLITITTHHKIMVRCEAMLSECSALGSQPSTNMFRFVTVQQNVRSLMMCRSGENREMSVRTYVVCGQHRDCGSLFPTSTIGSEELVRIQPAGAVILWNARERIRRPLREGTDLRRCPHSLAFSLIGNRTLRSSRHSDKQTTEQSRDQPLKNGTADKARLTRVPHPGVPDRVRERRRGWGSSRGVRSALTRSRACGTLDAGARTARYVAREIKIHLLEYKLWRKIDKSKMDKLDFQHVCIEVTFVIGSQFTRHFLDDSEPIADLQGNRYRVPILPGVK